MKYSSNWTQYIDHQLNTTYSMYIMPVAHNAPMADIGRRQQLIWSLTHRFILRQQLVRFWRTVSYCHHKREWTQNHQDEHCVAVLAHVPIVPIQTVPIDLAPVPLDTEHFEMPSIHSRIDMSSYSVWGLVSEDWGAGLFRSLDVVEEKAASAANLLLSGWMKRMLDERLSYAWLA